MILILYRPIYKRPLNYKAFLKKVAKLSYTSYTTRLIGNETYVYNKSVFYRMQIVTAIKRDYANIHTFYDTATFGNVNHFTFLE